METMTASPTNSPQQQPTVSRRRFLKRSAVGLGAALVGGLAYTAFEAGWINIVEERITVPRLPSAFAGKRLVFLTDLHHGPFTGLSYIETVVERTNTLAPDLICLGGDFIHRSSKYIEPCINALGGLRAPMGVFAVLGNHDHWHAPSKSSRCLRENGIAELKNRGEWLELSGDRLRLGGIDDLWTTSPDIPEMNAALGDATDDDACLLLSHNPDFTEWIRDKRVSLVLSGHTHGGQAVFPILGAPFTASTFGQKYLRGLCQGPVAQVFVSRGLGTVTPPLRFCCRPEINVLELV